MHDDHMAIVCSLDVTHPCVRHSRRWAHASAGTCLVRMRWGSGRLSLCSSIFSGAASSHHSQESCIFLGPPFLKLW